MKPTKSNCFWLWKIKIFSAFVCLNRVEWRKPRLPQIIRILQGLHVLGLGINSTNVLVVNLSHYIGHYTTLVVGFTPLNYHKTIMSLIASSHGQLFRVEEPQGLPLSGLAAFARSY